MSNIEISKKIKVLRTQLGFSQEELANKCNLSLRTVQRIEHGENEPRGYTLRKLADALHVSSVYLTGNVKPKDKNLIAFLNLAALSFLVMPLLGIIIPFLFWWFKRDTYKEIDSIGKRIINFQMTWLILFGLWYIWLKVTAFFNSEIRVPTITLKNLMLYDINGLEIIVIGIPIILYTYNFCFIIINTVRAYNSRNTYYKPSLTFLR